MIDTNVVVGGLLTHTPDSPLASIVDGMVEGRFPFLLSPSLLNEYRSVVGATRSAAQPAAGTTLNSPASPTRS